MTCPWEEICAEEFTMKRDAVINVVLIIAGILLAIALFGAGVLWKSGAEKARRSLPFGHFVFRGENWSGTKR